MTQYTIHNGYQPLGYFQPAGNDMDNVEHIRSVCRQLDQTVNYKFKVLILSPETKPKGKKYAFV